MTEPDEILLSLTAGTIDRQCRTIVPFGSVPLFPFSFRNQSPISWNS